jgi:DNA (cytosine-5)-methyltransferase 1
MKKNNVSVCDIFSGCGGFSLGAKMAGFDIDVAVEKDKWCAETFTENFPETHVFWKDVMDFTEDEITQHFPSGLDVLIGGPPCQGFSVSNINKDPKDPRNTLFQEFIRFTRILNPKACVLENVKGLVKAKNQNGDNVLEIILNEFEQLGYNTTFRVLNAADYGIPQNRHRLFIVATRQDIKPYSWPDQTHTSDHKQTRLSSDSKLSPHVTLGQAINDLPIVTVYNRTNTEYSNPPSCDYQSIMREGSKVILKHHEPMKHTARIIERFKEIKVGEGEASVNLRNAPAKRGSSEETSEKRYSQNHRRLDPNKPSNTIPASSHTNFIHPEFHRNFTVRELMRIQSFPDYFTLCGKRAVLSKSLSKKKGLIDDIWLDHRQQIGNAVPPLLAKILLTNVLISIGSGENESD